MIPGGLIAILIVLIVIGGATVSVVAYFRLQRHRADAVAMAQYRKLAAEAVTRQDALESRLGELTERLAAIEKLLRSVERVGAAASFPRLRGQRRSTC